MNGEDTVPAVPTKVLGTTSGGERERADTPLPLPALTTMRPRLSFSLSPRKLSTHSHLSIRYIPAQKEDHISAPLSLEAQ